MCVTSMPLNELIRIYEEAIKLGKERGKKVGDDLGKEFFEILKKKGKKIEFLGIPNQDSDLITGNLREKGIKILNLNEEMRRNKK